MSVIQFDRFFRTWLRSISRRINAPLHRIKFPFSTCVCTYTGPVGRLLAISELSDSDERIFSRPASCTKYSAGNLAEIYMNSAESGSYGNNNRSNFHDFKPRVSRHHRSFFVFRKSLQCSTVSLGNVRVLCFCGYYEHVEISCR